MVLGTTAPNAFSLFTDVNRVFLAIFLKQLFVFSLKKVVKRSFVLICHILKKKNRR